MIRSEIPSAPAPSHLRSGLKDALLHLFDDTEQIRSLVHQVNILPAPPLPDEKSDVLISRLLFDMEQLNDSLVRTKTHLAALMHLTKT